MRTAVDQARKRAAAEPGHAAEARLRRFEDLLKQWQAPPERTTVAIRLQALRIGELAMVAMPGEPFAEIGQAIRKASPFPFTMFCGYSSGEGGEYIPVESEYAHLGYEVDRTPYGPQAAATVIREAVALFPAIK